MRHLIAGLILLVLGAWGIIAWWTAFGQILRGLVPLFLILLGLTAVGAAYQKATRRAEHEDEHVEEPSGGRADRATYPRKNRLAG